MTKKIKFIFGRFSFTTGVVPYYNFQMVVNIKNRSVTGPAEIYTVISYKGQTEIQIQLSPTVTVTVAVEELRKLLAEVESR